MKQEMQATLENNFMKRVKTLINYLKMKMTLI